MTTDLSGFTHAGLKARLRRLGMWRAMAETWPRSRQRTAVLRRLRGLSRAVLEECGRRAGPLTD